jgi:hypothetical protein
MCHPGPEYPPTRILDVLTIWIMRYTPEQKRAILAGTSASKGAIWNQMPLVLDQLSRMGIVRVHRVPRADGGVDTYFLGLSDYGIREAAILGAFNRVESLASP